MKSTCWDTRATDSIIKSGQKDTEASITDNHKFLAKSHSGTLRIIDPIRLMSVFFNYCSNTKDGQT